MKIYILNTGGTLGMVGNPLEPAKSAAQIMEGLRLPPGIEYTLDDFPLKEDSTNWFNRDRIDMARRIEKAYPEHDAFVIFHGTDTLAETAATFCMIFKSSLQKPLIIIGAQMSKDEPGSDAPKQIEDAIRASYTFTEQEIVGVYSLAIGNVYDGSRLRKMNESAFNFLDTPGRAIVARVYPRIRLESGVRRRDPRTFVQGLRLDTAFETKIVTLRPNADTPPWVLTQILKGPGDEKLAGIILEAKGAGNIPDRAWNDTYTHSLTDTIKTATEAGIMLGILSPFEDGQVDLNRYKLGQKAKVAGALSLESLTPAMAEVKFGQALALYPGNREMIQAYISTDIMGELLPHISLK